MKIQKLRIQNYTSINDISIEFGEYYTAFCGQNNAGKSNILAAIGLLLGHYRRVPRHYNGGTVTNRYSTPNWLEDTDGPILEMEIMLSKEEDSGIFDNNPNIPDKASKATIKIVHNKNTSISVNGKPPLGPRNMKGMLRDLEEGLIKYDSAYYHNIRDRSYMEISENTRKNIKRPVEQINRELNKDLKRNREKLESFLGRLNEKYNLTLSTPYGHNIDRLISYEINLGYKKDNHMSLDLWGSGTQNRTLILDAIFKAKNQQESEGIVCPVLIIEEPESFLHPSAQLQFGQLLQDLAKELKVQIIVATHSLHMLSYQDPRSNLLVERHTFRGGIRESRIRETTGDNWVLPFNSVLGASEAFNKTHKDLIFSASNTLYVEGETDEKYINLLVQEGHVSGDFQVISIGGVPNWIKNDTILDVLQKHSEKKAFLLDKDAVDEKCIKTLGNAGIKIMWAGAGDIKSIEGLVPEELRNNVISKNSEIMLSMAYEQNKKSAANRIKQLTFEAFKQSSDSNKFNGFKSLINEINKFFKP